MTHDRDIERLVSHWLDDGPTTAPDRVIDVVADRIGRQRQRTAWRLRWKEPLMNPGIRVVAGLAAVVIAAVGAVYLVRPSPAPGVTGPGGAATPSPVPSAQSSVASSPSAVPSPQAIASVTFKPVVRLTAPAGWSVTDGDRTFGLGPPAGSPAGAGISLMSGPFVTFKDKDCEDQPPAVVGTTVAQAIASLTADRRLDTTAPAPITIGGVTGKMVDISVAPTWTGTCGWSGGAGAALIVSATTTGPAFGTGGTGRDRYIFLDLGRSVAAINISTSDRSTFEAFLADATPIVESMRFTP